MTILNSYRKQKTEKIADFLKFYKLDLCFLEFLQAKKFKVMVSVDQFS